MHSFKDRANMVQTWCKNELHHIFGQACHAGTMPAYMPASHISFYFSFFIFYFYIFYLHAGISITVTIGKSLPDLEKYVIRKDETESRDGETMIPA